MPVAKDAPLGTQLCHLVSAPLGGRADGKAYTFLLPSAMGCPLAGGDEKRAKLGGGGYGVGGSGLGRR